MARRKGQKVAEPWWFDRQKAYYLILKGKWIRLSADREEAWQKYFEIMACQNKEEHTLDVATVAAQFLEHCEARVGRSGKSGLSESQYELYVRYISQFCQSFGRSRCTALDESHFESWMDSKIAEREWGDSSISAATKAVKRCFNWAVERKLLTANPIANVKAPETPSRDVVVDQSTHEIMMAATDESFRAALDAMYRTGCRPGEICKVTTDHVIEGRLWLLDAHKRSRYGKRRVVRLTEHMQEVTARLVLKREPGQCLFLNSRGNPWKPDAIRNRIDRLQEKLKLPNVFAYAYRHTAASNMIMEGVDVLTVANLLGTSPQMVMKHYGHLLASDEELAKAQEKAVRRRKGTG